MGSGVIHVVKVDLKPETHRKVKIAMSSQGQKTRERYSEGQKTFAGLPSKIPLQRIPTVEYPRSTNKPSKTSKERSDEGVYQRKGEEKVMVTHRTVGKARRSTGEHANVFRRGLAKPLNSFCATSSASHTLSAELSDRVRRYLQRILHRRRRSECEGQPFQSSAYSSYTIKTC